MSPDSFLLDPFLLFLGGFVLAVLWERRWKRDGFSRWLPIGLGLADLAIFWVVSISLWFDTAWTEGFARRCGAETGRAWMLNSGVFHFDYKSPPSVGLQVFAVVFFASYLGWILIGARVGARVARPAGGQ